MIPYMQKGDLRRLPLARQKAICGCAKQCEVFITFTGKRENDFMLCAEDAKQFGFEILEMLEIVTKSLAFPKSKYGWTTEQERFVINYIKKNKRIGQDGRILNGTYTLIGEMLGKSREQIKDKVNHLRRAGRL